MGAAAGAILLRLALDPFWGGSFPYITLFPAIMLSAWVGGLVPGIVTTAICAAAAQYFWVEPAGSWAVTNRSEILGLAVFVLVGAVISALNETWRRTMAGLAESEERLRVTLASIGDGVITTDDQGLVTGLNGVAEQLTGWSGLDAVGRLLREVFVIIDEHSREPAENPVDRVLREGRVSGLANHTLLLTRDGREIPISDSAAPIGGEDGKTAGVVMVFRDITQRRRAEREQTALLERERSSRREAELSASHLRAALRAGRLGSWHYTVATGKVIWSPELEAIHGLEPGTFPGTFEAFRNEIHPADREHVLGAISSAIEQKREHHVQYRIVRSDGVVRWVEGAGQVAYDEDGRPNHMIGVCADITQRREADERFRLAVEAAPAAMLMVDGQGKIVLANALTERLLGYSRSELIGEPVERLVPLRFRACHPELRSAFLEDAHPRTMGAGRDLHAVRKDGSEVPVEIGLSPIDSQEGTFVLAAVTDITERKKVEAQRAQLLERERLAHAELARANRLKDDFLAMLSHELRNPLNAILGYVDLLVSGILPPDRAVPALHAIQRAAQAQARLVETILDLSRIEAGKLELDVVPLDLRNVLDDAVEVVRPDADAKGVRLDVRAGTPVTAIGDSGRLQQVFWNLLQNAIKFTPPGGEVRVTLAELGTHAWIEIRDNGQGIDPEFLPHVFDRFAQAEGRQEHSRGGLGLGLALVRELVHAHGGTVAAASRGPGLGSTFSVTLPVSLAEARSVSKKPEASREAQPSA
jgi:PAS domain S-box-containing protein